MLYAFPSFNHLGALDICVVHWDLIPLERNPVNALIIDETMVGNKEEVNLTDVTLVSDDNFCEAQARVRQGWSRVGQ